MRDRIFSRAFVAVLFRPKKLILRKADCAEQPIVRPFLGPGGGARRRLCEQKKRVQLVAHLRQEVADMVAEDVQHVVILPAGGKILGGLSVPFHARSAFIRKNRAASFLPYKGPKFFRIPKNQSASRPRLIDVLIANDGSNSKVAPIIHHEKFRHVGFAGETRPKNSYVKTFAETV